MENPWPENLPADRKQAIQELIRGRQFTNQLRVMLGKSIGDDGSVTAEDLVMKILGTFTNTLSILSSESDEVSQIPANTVMNSRGWDGRKSEDSGESSKTSTLKDRRGCYKRRKTSHTLTKETPTLIDDGHAWRKYGQKVILNAKFPRNYFRCTHKFDQGCQATKQVQRTEENPAMYRTTYHGFHTCKTLLKPPQLILDASARDTSILLSFESNDPNHKPNDPFVFSSIKQEYNREGFPATLNRNQFSLPSDYLLPSDLTAYDSPGPMTTVMSSGSDHGDVISSGVYSCTASTHSFEMDDIMVGSDFDDVLQFEF